MAPFNLVVVYSLSHVWLFATPWAVAHQASLSTGLPGQEYWSGLPLPSLGDLPDPGLKPRSNPACMIGGFFTIEPPRSLNCLLKDPLSKHIHIQRYWELGLQHRNFKGHSWAHKHAGLVILRVHAANVAYHCRLTTWVTWLRYVGQVSWLSFQFPYCALCSKTVSCSPHLRSGFIFHKIPRRNTGVKLHDFCFSSRISGHQKHKQKKKKQTYRTHWSQNCVSVDIIKKGKRQPTEQEKILANSVSDKGLVSRLYKERNSTTKRQNSSFYK